MERNSYLTPGDKAGLARSLIYLGVLFYVDGPDREEKFKDEIAHIVRCLDMEEEMRVVAAHVEQALARRQKNF